MSIQDDVFDVADHLKGSQFEEAFDRIANQLWQYEQKTEDLYDAERLARDLGNFIKKYAD